MPSKGIHRALLVPLLVMTSGCAPKKFAVNKIGESLAGSGTTLAADDVPRAGDATPSSLKEIESRLAETPRHQGLLLAAASGFTQYASASVQQDADLIESQDPDRATALRERARRLFLVARDYGLRGLDGRHDTLSRRLARDPATAVQITRKKDVPLLYWTAAAWASAIALSKDIPDLAGDRPIVDALIDRALVLDPDFDAGAIHGFLIAYEPARQGAAGDPLARSRMHFDREVVLTRGQLASAFVSLAEVVSVQHQDRAEFESMLSRALAVDTDARPEWRLQNIVAQRRARWLLTREDELIPPDE